MDFVTQVTLGAAVGQATMHRELGNKAALWGMLGGALPDLDVLAYPLLDPVAQLAWHRGISHGILLTVVLSPLLGWLIARIHAGRITLEKTTFFVFLALASHILIDLFTTYGTQVFAPFDSTPYSFNTLFIIDPLYTLPLLIFLLWSLFPGETRARMFRNAAGLIFSSAYVIVALLLKFSTLSAFERALDARQIVPQRIMTTATPFNTLLWRCVAETGDGFHIGYRSVFDTREAVSFWYVPRNDELLAAFEGQRALETLRWFSDGWYSVQADDEGIHFHDLRFGEFDTTDPALNFGLGNPVNLEYTFSFRFVETGAADGPERYTIDQADFRIEGGMDVLAMLWKRIKGMP
ncbi:MAG: metal-dependent hydrolase [Bacteroidota bacterium]|jgi:inner membrane protein|nr:metal-dependent hydrolase [Bacteroidota bacterium]